MPQPHNLKVLIVDDQQSMRGLMRYGLQQLGIRNVVEAKDGGEALQALLANKFDLVMSDWNMEGMDGLTLLKTIRANALIKKTPFIMSTGQKDQEKVREAIQAGVNNYIVKPFNVETLRKKIEAVIGKLE
jgi:two-component system chemotaxis response regulator CheY